MKLAERTLVVTTDADLDAALSEVARAANGRARTRRVEWSDTERADFHRAVRAQPEGTRQWNGGPAPHRAHVVRTTVAAAWWTDRLGRKHVRVAGQRAAFSRLELRNLLAPSTDPVPSALVHVASRYAFVRRCGKVYDVVVVCDCGVAGTPEVVGWMGDRCAACHDRCAEGEMAAPPLRVDLGSEVPVVALALSADGALLARSDHQCGVLVLDRNTGQVEQLAMEGVPPLHLAFAPDGERLATFGFGPGAIWKRGGQREAPAVPEGESWVAAFTPAGELVVLALGRPSDPALSLHLPGGAVVRLPAGWEDGPTAAAFAPGGALLAIGYQGGLVRLWDVAAGQPGSEEEGDGDVVGLEFAGPWLLVVRWNGESTAWDLVRDVARRVFPDRQVGRIVSLGGPDLLVNVHARELSLWEGAGLRERATLLLPGHRIEAVAASADGLWLATEALGEVRLWQRTTLEALAGAGT